MGRHGSNATSYRGAKFPKYVYDLCFKIDPISPKQERKKKVDTRVQRYQIAGVNVSENDIELFKTTGSPSKDSLCFKPKNLIVPKEAVEHLKIDPSFVEMRIKLFARMVEYQENPESEGPSVTGLYQELGRLKYSLLKKYGAR